MGWISSWLPELIIKKKKTVILTTIIKSFLVKQTALFFSQVRTVFFVKDMKFKKRKTLKKELIEELMAIAWHPKVW